MDPKIETAKLGTGHCQRRLGPPCGGPKRRQVCLELGRRSIVERCENVIALGPSGTGKTHIALGLGLAACQKGLAVGFTTAADLVHELMEARDDKQLLRLQTRLAKLKFLIIDELGFVPLSTIFPSCVDAWIEPTLPQTRFKYATVEQIVQIFVLANRPTNSRFLRN